MNRPGTVVLDWADSEHAFRLGFAELEELQEKTDCGPVALLDRLRTGQWRVADIRETLRLALIGGGLKPLAALPLVRRYVEGFETSLLDNAPVATAVLLAALVATKDQRETLPDSGDDSPGEPPAETAPTETAPTGDVSPSPPSAPTSAPSDIRPSKSTSSRSSKRSPSSKAGTASRAAKRPPRR